MFNTWIKLGNQCDHNYIVDWPPANPCINDQFKNIKCCFSQNVNFRHNTLLHGALHISLQLTVSLAFAMMRLELLYFRLFLPCSTFFSSSLNLRSLRNTWKSYPHWHLSFLSRCTSPHCLQVLRNPVPLRSCEVDIISERA